jgi:hypothetical protein
MTELEKLKKYLDEHDYNSCWNYVFGQNDQIVVFENHERSWDVVCHHWSYGGDKGLLELYGCLCEDVIGWLTADDVIKILEYKSKQGAIYVPICSMDDIKED